MTPAEVVAKLQHFNDWRRGGDIDQPGPLAVGEAIDAAVEMIERLEAAENDAAHQKALAESALRVAKGWERKRDALRTKIEAMERQEPFDAGHPEFRRAFDAALKTGNWPTERQNFGYRSPMSQMAWQVAFCTVNNLKLYALPGAQGATE